MSVYPRGRAPRAIDLTVIAPEHPRVVQTIALPACPSRNHVLQCTVTMPLTPGTHILDVKTSGTDAVRLSNNRIFVNIRDCQLNFINLSLYRAAASIGVASEDPNVVWRSGNFFGPFGGGTFWVTATDADGNDIVGPNAPQLSVHSSESKIHALLTDDNTLSLSLDGSVPFDTRFHSRITISSGTAKKAFGFSTEFTTWPTVTPSPTPAPCS